jgi:bifunctional DNase/RNase
VRIIEVRDNIFYAELILDRDTRVSGSRSAEGRPVQNAAASHFSSAASATE